LPLSPYACANCGFWQAWFAPPPDCPVCTDVRNDLPEDGWRFLPEADVAATHWTAARQVAPDLWAFTTTPALGLAGTGWLILREDGNIAFEAAPSYSTAALGRIEALGGIRFLAASHVHGYGGLFQLQRAFEPPVVAIHADDLQLTKGFRVTAPYDEPFELAPGYTLHPVGGHYAGQAVLHDAPGRRLFCGDMFKVDQDEAGRSHAISSHKAFHKNIPLTHRELRRYRDVIAGLDFDAVLTPFEYAPEVGRDLALAALDAALARPPGVVRHPVAEPVTLRVVA
jgi:glyoxylase-like metal-dependent hydrolase (beta-lactamase superfamily II)